MDGLSAIFHSLSLRARLVFAGGLRRPWVVDHNSEQTIWFHLVTKGCGWVHSPAWPKPLRLETGNLVLFLPHARKHYLSYSPGDATPDLPGARAAHWPQSESGMFCGLI